MSLRKLSVALLCCFVWAVPCTTSSAQKAETAKIVIKVTDQTGAPIPNTRIRVIPAPEPRPALAQTDSQGQLELVLKLGGHALFVSAPGFASFVRHIEVAPSNVETTIPVVMRIGPFGGPIVVMDKKEAAKWAAKLLLSAMPYHQDWWITSDEFKFMPHVSVVLSNPETGKKESYSGVRLSDLLARVGVPTGAEFDGLSLNSYLLANGNPKLSETGSVLFSLAELQPALHSGEILVANSMNGRPLGSQLGPFMLVVSADEHRVRWVEKLRELILKP